MSIAEAGDGTRSGGGGEQHASTWKSRCCRLQLLKGLYAGRGPAICYPSRGWRHVIPVSSGSRLVSMGMPDHNQIPAALAITYEPVIIAIHCTPPSWRRTERHASPSPSLRREVSGQRQPTATVWGGRGQDSTSFRGRPQARATSRIGTPTGAGAEVARSRHPGASPRTITHRCHR